nr:reverse transcriptase domain-containing protein [Tanacetum cinerariifolium]
MVENSNLEEHLPPVVTMADNRTMAELLRAPTERYAEAIVVPLIFAEQFELKHSLINIMTSDQFFGLKKDNPHDHIRWGSPPVLKKEPSRGNLLERSTQDVLTIIENKSKVRNSQSKPIASQLKACDTNSNSEIAKLTHAVNEQTSDVTTAMTAMLKQFQATPPPAPVKAVEETCVTCGGAHLYYQCLAAGGNTFPEFKDNIQGYVSAAAVNYNQGNPGYCPQGVTNQMRRPRFAQPNVQNNQNRFGPPQGFNHGNNFNQEQSYQAAAQQNQNFHLNELEKIKRMNEASLSNQTNEIKNMMASLLQMNIASTLGLGSLPTNTVANPKGELKAITTRSGLVTDGPTVPNPSKSSTPEVGERVEETYTDPDLAEYTIKQEKDEVQIQKFWQMFKQLHINVTLAEALVLMPNGHPKKLPEKLGDPGKFLIPCGFSERKCKDLADLGASINLMPLSVWKELGLPELIPTRMTLELANRAICTPVGIARDVFVPVGKFTFPADFVIVDYESDPRVPLILGRPFLKTARALIDVHGEEMIPDLANLDDNFVDPIPEMFTDEHAPDYSSPLIFDVYDDDFLEVESDAENVYDDPFDSKGEKIKESKLLIDELDLPCYFLPPLEYDSFTSQDFSKVDALPSTNNEDKMKEKQEKDKIKTKPDKNGKREEAQQCQSPVTIKKAEKEKKIQI